MPRAQAPITPDIQAMLPHGIDAERINGQRIARGGLFDVMAKSPEGQYLRRNPQTSHLFGDDHIPEANALGAHLFANYQRGYPTDANTAAAIMASPAYAKTLARFKGGSLALRLFRGLGLGT